MVILSQSPANVAKSDMLTLLLPSRSAQLDSVQALGKRNSGILFLKKNARRQGAQDDIIIDFAGTIYVGTACNGQR